MGGAGSKCNICHVLLFLLIDSRNNVKAEAIPNGASVLETLKTRVQLCSGEQSWGISQGLAFGGLGLLDQESGNQSCRCPALLRGVGIVWDWDEEKGIREFRRSALFVTSEESKKKKEKKKRKKRGLDLCLGFPHLFKKD